MNREFLKGLDLSDEHVDSIMKEHGKTVNSIKDKADKVDSLESQIEDYEKQIKDRDKQLKDLSKQSEGNEDLQKQIKDLQKANDDAKKDFDTKLAEQKKEAKLEIALKDAKAKNLKSVKANLDLDKISLDGDNIIGLDEQLTALKESDAYLFGEADRLGGRNPHPSNPHGAPTQKKFADMTSEERMEFREQDPQAYQKARESHLNQ